MLVPVKDGCAFPTIPQEDHSFAGKSLPYEATPLPRNCSDRKHAEFAPASWRNLSVCSFRLVRLPQDCGLSDARLARLG